MLPSVSAQKLAVTGPSWASADVTLRTIALENALSVDLIRVGYRRFRKACQPIDRSMAHHAGPCQPAISRFRLGQSTVI
jgi:hypothetical protein